MPCIKKLPVAAGCLWLRFAVPGALLAPPPCHTSTVGTIVTIRRIPRIAERVNAVRASELPCRWRTTGQGSEDGEETLTPAVITMANLDA